MEQPAMISNEKVTEFCLRQQRLEDKLDEVCGDIKELKGGFEKQRNDFAVYRSDNGDLIANMVAKMDEKIDTSCKGICQVIGEVPSGESVMSNVRSVNSRVDHVYWTFGVVLAVIEFIANFQKIAEVFK